MKKVTLEGLKGPVNKRERSYDSQLGTILSQQQYFGVPSVVVLDGRKGKTIIQLGRVLKRGGQKDRQGEEAKRRSTEKILDESSQVRLTAIGCRRGTVTVWIPNIIK